MANLKSLQERIKSVSSIQQVTKAMKMVAAAKVKKAQDKMEISRPYSKNTQEMICRILPQVSNDNIALVNKRKVSKKECLMIIHQITTVPTITQITQILKISNLICLK